MVRRFLNLLLALGIVSGAAAIAWLLFATRPEAAQAPLEERALPVDVLEVHKAEHGITVRAMGEVKAAAELLLQPQVSGKVLEVSSNLVPGGRVTQDELLVRVDKRDYATMLAAQQAAVEQAAVRREEEKSLRKIAEHEWQGTNVSDEARQLALREPHLQAASAQVQSARSQLDKARRDIKKTQIRAPFDGIVLEEYIDIGQIVAPGVTVARIAGTEHFWVQISVPVADLPRLEVPGINTNELEGSPAKIILEPSPGTRVEREGYVERMLGSVDPRGRMAQLLVTVDDPLQLRLPTPERSLPLLIGSYVKLELEGRPLPSAVELPTEAVDDKGRVWVVENDTLQLREVEVAWRQGDAALVTGGLEDGDRVVVSPAPTATKGMPAVIENTWQAGKPGPLASAGSE